VAIFTALHGRLTRTGDAVIGAAWHRSSCFTFIKLGPMAGHSGKGHLFTMIGFFCKAPGQPLDVTMAAAMVSAIQVKTE